MPLQFNVINISKYIDLDRETIVAVKCGPDIDSYRALEECKKKQIKRRTKRKSFYNQVTLVINSINKNINVKLFLNGAIQITGCHSPKQAEYALIKLFDKLKVIKGIFNKNGSITPKQFVSEIDKLDIKNVYDFKTVMINSNFNIGFRIDRDKLYDILLKDKYECSYDPIIHACVDIRYKYDNDKKISIFVFESGAIIITGSNHFQHILDTYKHINVYLLSHYNNIVKTDPLHIKAILNYI
jgi:TATA-box binding protein (TBP) (component of TFIID and TFIIIB)